MVENQKSMYGLSQECKAHDPFMGLQAMNHPPLWVVMNDLLAVLLLLPVALGFPFRLGICRRPVLQKIVDVLDWFGKAFSDRLRLEARLVLLQAPGRWFPVSVLDLANGSVIDTNLPAVAHSPSRQN